MVFICFCLFVCIECVVLWWDVGGFMFWYGFIIVVGFFIDGVFFWLLIGVIVVGIGLIWL